MKQIRTLLAIAAVCSLAAWSGWGQAVPSGQAQANANASTNANVSAGHHNANASGQAGVSATQNTGTQANGTTAATNASGSGAASANGNATLASGSTIHAVLTKSLDAKKAKEGEEVTAKTTEAVRGAGEITVPKGAKLIGHITKATSRAKGDSESSLGILFDRAEIGKGREVPVHAVIQALATTRATTSGGDDMAGVGESGGMAGGAYPSGGGMNGGATGTLGGTVAGVGRTAGNTVGQAGNSVGNVGGTAVGATAGVNNTVGTVGTNANSTLSATAQGAIGMPGYALQSAANAGTEGSIVTSTGKTVKLESGTQLILRVISE